MSAKKKPYVLPSYAAFEAYLDSRRWESDTDGFIHEYCEYSKKQKSLGSEEFRLAAGRLLTRALGYFDELRAAGKEIPDMKTGAPCEKSKAAPKPKPVATASRKKGKSPSPPPANNNGSDVSPGTLALIAAAEEAEKAEKAKKTAKTPGRPLPPPPSSPPPPSAKKTLPPPSAKKPGPPPSLPPPSAKKPGLSPAAAAAAAAVAPAPLGAMPRAGAAVAAVPGVTPASCGRMTPEFIERWVADNYSHLPRGDPYGPRREEIHPAFNSEFEIKENAGGGTCLIHAFLTDLSPTYRAMTHAAKVTVGAAFRKHIYAMLYPSDERMRIQEPDYLRFHTRPSIDARVIEREENGYVNEAEFEGELYDALARAYIRDTTGYLYDDDIQKLRNCFKVRIIIVTQNPDRDYDIFRLGPSSPEELAAEFAAEQEANVENGYTRYIMIYQEGVHFEAVRRRGTDQYIFIYPEVQAILEASRGTATAIRARLIELFAPGTPVIARIGEGRVKKLVVAADGVRYAREFGGPVAPVEAVYLEPANHSTPPVLYPVESILSVAGAGFRISDYQPVEMPPSPEGVFASPASGSPEPNANNARYPPLTLVESPKRKGKGTRRKSSPPKATAAATRRSPSPPKKAAAAAAAVAPKHVTPRRKSKSPSPPVLSAAPSNSNNEAGAKKGK